MNAKTTETPAEAVSAILSAGAMLSREQAEALTAKLIGVFTDSTLDMITTAYVGKVWKPLNFATWEAWCDAHLGVRLRLMKPQQDLVVKRLTEAGASSRAIAAVLGVSAATAFRAQRKAQGNPVVAPKAKSASNEAAEATETPSTAGTAEAQAEALLYLLGNLASLDVQRVALPELFPGVVALDKVLDEAALKLAALKSRVAAEVQVQKRRSIPEVAAHNSAIRKATAPKKAPTKAAAKALVTAGA